MNAVFEWKHEVRPDEADALGHANNEAYLRWMNRAATAHSAALGWPVEAYLQLGQGWVVRRHEIDYVRPALPGDRIVIRTWIQSVEKAVSWRGYEVVTPADGVLRARGRTLWVWINYRTGRPTRLPGHVRTAFPIAISDPGSPPSPGTASAG